MITEDYVSFEIAKLLKEKGFDEPCAWQYYTYWEGGELKNYERPVLLDKMLKNSQVIDKDNATAPTLQMAMKWLREVHKLFIQTWILSENGYWFNIIKLLDNYYHKDLYSTGLKDIYYSTEEEAVEAAIEYCLKHLI